MAEELKKGVRAAMNEKRAVQRMIDERMQSAPVKNEIGEKLDLVVGYIRALKSNGEKLLDWDDVRASADDAFPDDINSALVFFKEENEKLVRMIAAEAELYGAKNEFYKKMFQLKASIRDVKIALVEKRGKDSSYRCEFSTENVRANLARRISVHFAKDRTELACVKWICHKDWAQRVLLWSRIASLPYNVLMAARDVKGIGEYILLAGLKEAYKHFADDFCHSRGDLCSEWFF